MNKSNSKFKEMQETVLLVASEQLPMLDTQLFYAGGEQHHSYFTVVMNHPNVIACCFIMHNPLFFSERECQDYNRPG